MRARDFRRLPFLVVFAALAVAGSTAMAADLLYFTEFSLQNSSADVVLPGRLFIPREAISSPSAPRPFMVFLHGGGASGTNNTAQVEQTPDFMLEQARSRGAYLYVPQTATNWSSMTTIDSVAAMIDRAQTEFSIDANRLYVTGFSNGGGGTWNLLSRSPGRFAAAVAISSVIPAPQFNAANLLGTAIFALHARNDATIPVSRSRNVVSEILSAAGEPLPSYPSSVSPLNYLVWNPHLEFHRDLAASAPPGSTISHLIQRPDLDLIYFESSAGGHTGLVGALSAPPTYEWLFTHSLPVPEPMAPYSLLGGLAFGTTMWPLCRCRRS